MNNYYKKDCYNTNYYNDEVKEILVKLVKLQKEAVKEEINDQMCDFNALGKCDRYEFNTRPLQIYTINDKPWYCPINSNEGDCNPNQHKTTCVFRVEKVDGDTATFRALSEKEHNGYDRGIYHSTDSYITIKLKNIAAIRCLKDCFVDLCIF